MPSPRPLPAAPVSFALPLLLACLAACSSSSSSTGQTAADASSDQAVVADGALPPADGPFACGTSTCTPSQYCVQECSCGGVQACMPLPDGSSTCPTGQQLQGNCCIIPCSNPPPACQDVPSCGGGFTMSRNVQCPCPG